MNVSRRLPDNNVNFEEPNQQAIWMTSAGTKTSYAYDQMLETIISAVINPDNTFFLGCDYRVPALHGLIDRSFVQKQQVSAKQDAFSTEYMSKWLGSSEESWYNFDKLSKYRKIKNPEMHKNNRPDVKQFYLLSVDVGRLHDQSVVTVFRVNYDANGRHFTSVVNIRVLGLTPETRTFTQQAIDIKKMIKDYEPREVVIDCNGLGVGLADVMIQEQTDSDGVVWPAYGFFNNEDYKKIQPRNCECILYSLKASGSLKSNINGNAYARTSNGSVRFLTREQEARSALLATKIGQKMTPFERAKRLLPHEMTTNLFNQMLNLRIKKTGTADIVLEPINTRYPDDKYYSFAYGLWRIKEIEEEYTKKKQRRSSGRQLVFYTGGKKK